MVEVEASGGIGQISAFAKKSTIKVQSLALDRWVLQYLPSLIHLQDCFAQAWTFVTMSLQDSNDPCRSQGVASKTRIKLRMDLVKIKSAAESHRFI